MMNKDNSIKINGTANRIAQKMEQKIREEEEIISNFDYIKWLEKFTKRYPNFTDIDWLYEPEKISKEDLENVNKLCSLFSAINNYAKTNYITTIKKEFTLSYKFTYNNKIYEIGIMQGQGAVFFCYSRIILGKKKEKNFISFENVCKGKNLLDIDFIQSKMDELTNILEKYISSGIPINSIKSTVDKVLKKYS